MYDSETFWSNTKSLIKERNKTQRGLSAEIGLSERTIEQWIQRNSLPNAAEAAKIAEALNTTVEYLVTGKTCSNHISAETKSRIKDFIDAL